MINHGAITCSSAFGGFLVLNLRHSRMCALLRTHEDKEVPSEKEEDGKFRRTGYHRAALDHGGGFQNVAPFSLALVAAENNCGLIGRVGELPLPAPEAERLPRELPPVRKTHQTGGERFRRIDRRSRLCIPGNNIDCRLEKSPPLKRPRALACFSHTRRIDRLAHRVCPEQPSVFRAEFALAFDQFRLKPVERLSSDICDGFHGI